MTPPNIESIAKGRSELLPVFHMPDGRRIVGWPGSWQHRITSARQYILEQEQGDG